LTNILPLRYNSGTGAVTEILLHNTINRVVGLDVSQGMMDQARHNLRNHPGFHKLELVKGNALSLPFINEMDVVTNFGGLGHIMNKDVPLFLKEVHKVLRPSGKFIFVTTEHPSVWSMAFWRSYIFNFLMHIRNKLISPPFIMYYLTFLLPKVKMQMENVGFDVEIKHGIFPSPFQSLKLVIATKT
jgi:ubiquinone/menaquinone biosynthesis C-methylase UbiE